jgi:hypothetical protein
MLLIITTNNTTLRRNGEKKKKTGPKPGSKMQKPKTQLRKTRKELDIQTKMDILHEMEENNWSQEEPARHFSKTLETLKTYLGMLLALERLCLHRRNEPEF